MKINLSEPFFFGKEYKNVKKTLTRKWISASGKTTKEFEKKLSQYLRIKNILGLINCTSALQLSIKLLRPENKDEIIVPSITFVASINAVIYNNCKPIFIDCDQNLLLDTKKVVKFLNEQTFMKNGFCHNKKTKKRILGVILVHTFGNLVNIDRKFILECKKKNIKIIEDAAESLGSYYKKNFPNSHAGSIGNFGCLSFNGNKIVTSGGGGAILFKKKQDLIRCRYLASQAKDDKNFFIHNEVGYNYLISDLHSAIGLSQMLKLNKVIKKKYLINNIYKKNINKIPGLKILTSPSYCKSNYWLNILLVDEKVYGISKKKIIHNFSRRNIETRSVWYPNHLQKPFKKFQSYQITKSFKLYDKALCLPSSYNLSKKNQFKIIQLLKNKFK